MAINIVNVPYLGDLYRLYVDDIGDVIEVRVYEDMGTAYRVVHYDDLSRAVKQIIESKYS